MKTFATTIAAAACLAGLAAAPAGAQGQDIRVQVDYADLDIGSDSGAAVLANRVEAKVARACASEARQLKQVMLCREQLISAAAEQLESQGAANVAGHLDRG